jgi:hypothetical protein
MMDPHMITPTDATPMPQLDDRNRPPRPHNVSHRSAAFSSTMGCGWCTSCGHELTWDSAGI